MFAHPRMFLIRFLSLMMTLVAALLCANYVHAQQAFFTGLGYLPGFEARSEAHDISGDGSIVVGRIETGAPDFRQQHFRWTRATGMVGLGPLSGGAIAYAPQISNDGSTIVGGLYLSYYRWQEATGATPLPLPPSYAPSVTWLAGLSNDGSKVAFTLHTWTETGGWIASPNNNSPGNMQIYDISGDGQSLIGHSANNQLGFIWSQQAVTELGPLLPDGAGLYNPRMFSADGKVVIGYASHVSGSSGSYRGWARWDEETGLTTLHGIGFSYVHEDFGISGDASIIVHRDSILRESRGWNLERLDDVLINEFGLASQLAGWFNLQASSISNDGRTIVGTGRNPAGKDEAWVAFLGTPVPEPSAARWPQWHSFR